MNDANKYSLQHADSLNDLATRICGFGFWANHNDDCEHPIHKDAVREYLEVGAAFQMKETEPKLQKLKKLADAMYHAAQYLTTDASHLRKAMEEYHQFIIQSEPQYYHSDDGTVTYEQDIRLVPMPFEPDKGPDYWKEKYCRLKERMQELINDKEE